MCKLPEQTKARQGNFSYVLSLIRRKRKKSTSCLQQEPTGFHGELRPGKDTNSRSHEMMVITIKQ